MSVSPTSVSENAARPDALEQLWAACLSARERRTAAHSLKDIAEVGQSPLETAAAACVTLHLSAYFALSGGCADDVIDGAEKAMGAWAALRAADEVVHPNLTPRSHAFHMRLASKHADFYHDVERRSLLGWVDAAQLKSRFLLALALEGVGRRKDALAEAVSISNEWRETAPIRLSGLKAIESWVSKLAYAGGDSSLARDMSDRATSLSGVHAPYPDDTPDRWGRPRQTEGILRFVFAATPIDPICLTAQNN